MHVTVIDPPAPLVSRTEAKRHLHVDHTDDDTYIDLLVRAASEALDGPKGCLGIAIGEQTLEVRFEAFDEDEILLPYGPVLSVTSIKYLDEDGVEQTFDEDLYQKLSDGRIRLLTDEAWPTLYVDEEAARVRYVAGHEDVPQKLKLAVLLIVGFVYANREASMDDALSHGPVLSLISTSHEWSV